MFKFLVSKGFKMMDNGSTPIEAIKQLNKEYTGVSAETWLKVLQEFQFKLALELYNSQDIDIKVVA